MDADSPGLERISAAIRLCADDVGRTPSAGDYHAWQGTHEGEPDILFIRKWFGSWKRVLDSLPPIDEET